VFTNFTTTAKISVRYLTFFDAGKSLSCNHMEPSIPPVNWAGRSGVEPESKRYHFSFRCRRWPLTLSLARELALIPVCGLDSKLTYQHAGLVICR